MQGTEMDSDDVEPVRDEFDNDDSYRGADLSSIYLRDTGAVPLLTKDDEVRLATRVQEAREALVQIFTGLPAGAREYVLEGIDELPRKSKGWTVAQLQGCHDRLRHFDKTRPGTSLREATRDAAREMRKLEEARDALVLANLRLVTHVVKKSQQRALPFLDLIQEGNIGLMRAVEKFEPERGHKFSTYAFWWIKQAINRAVDDKARTIRIPVHVTHKLKKIQRAVVELTAELDRQPTVGEIARRAKLKKEDVADLISVHNDPLAS
jgi:RNA polymerase sigma factor (sigma-70 family)